MSLEDWPTVLAVISWDAQELTVTSDSARVRKYRSQQSWYRETVLGVEPGLRHGSQDRVVGSMLRTEDVSANRRLNFISDAALAAADQRAIDVQSEGGTLEAHRLFHNLLSSMPMCFNIFGALAGVDGVAGLMRRCFDPDLAHVDDTVCEITPALEEPLGDRTAFDAMLRYSTSGGPAFVGIETKYTEPLSLKQYDNDRYREVTESSDWFVDGASDSLMGSATNQLWRGLMLASLVESETGARGRYAVVSTADDRAAIASVESVRKHLTDPDRLFFVSLELLVTVARSVGGELTTWADTFERRYIPTGVH